MKALGGAMRICAKLLLVSAMLSSQGLLAAVPGNAGQCSQAWDNIVNGSVSADIAKQISYWKSQSVRCASGLYEYRLANLYIQKHDYADAKRILRSALKKYPSQSRELLIGMADATSGLGEMQQAVDYANQAIRGYPDWFAGYRELGLLLFQQRKFAASIDYFDKANARHADPQTYKYLTMANYFTGHYQAATQAGEQAYRLDSGFGVDRSLMMILASAYMKEGKYKIAHGVLLLLAKNDPDMKSQRQFVDMYNEIVSHLNSGG